MSSLHCEGLWCLSLYFIDMVFKKILRVYGLSRVLHLGPQGQRELTMKQPEVRLTLFVVCLIPIGVD